MSSSWGAYFHALVGIFSHLSERPPTGVMRLGFITLFVALHSALPRWASAQLFDVDYPWYFLAGVANQYILGPGLQPSVFGVFLVVSVYSFLQQDRPFLAVAWSSLRAAVMHSTYLLVRGRLDPVVFLCPLPRAAASARLLRWSYGHSPSCRPC